jgi:predicted nucleic acid-binding protein
LFVLLDAGPLSLRTHPRAEIKNRQAAEWLVGLRSVGIAVRVPEIADYEVRRELLRAGKVKGLRRLDDLKEALGYLSLTTEVMLQAAQFWADARNQGQPTASDLALDADVILATQAAVLGREDDVAILPKVVVTAYPEEQGLSRVTGVAEKNLSTQSR